MAGAVLLAGSFWFFVTDHTSDNAGIKYLLVALPLLAGPVSWWISRHDEEVEKLIRRELLASFLATAFAVCVISPTKGKLHDTIANGALSLVTGALILSSFRVFIEACAVRLKQRNHPEIEPPDATS